MRSAALIALIAFPAVSQACRDAHPTHEARIEAADTAFVARVSGVRIHDLESRDNVGMGVAEVKFVFSPRVVNLALVDVLKGKTSHVSRIKVTQCRGSLDAKLGALVRVYRIHGDWWLTRFPGEAR